MTDQDWNRVEVMIIQAVNEAVKATVNGRIDKLNNKLDPEHETYILKDVVPIIEGYKGAKVLTALFKWLAGIIITCSAIYAIFTK